MKISPNCKYYCYVICLLIISILSYIYNGYNLNYLDTMIVFVNNVAKLMAHPVWQTFGKH